MHCAAVHSCGFPGFPFYLLLFLLSLFFSLGLSNLPYINISLFAWFLLASSTPSTSTSTLARKLQRPSSASLGKSRPSPLYEKSAIEFRPSASARPGIALHTKHTKTWLQLLASLSCILITSGASPSVSLTPAPSARPSACFAERGASWSHQHQPNPNPQPSGLKSSIIVQSRSSPCPCLFVRSHHHHHHHHPLRPSFLDHPPRSHSGEQQL